MKTRCLNPNADAYKDYGGRGITICEPWLKFENFWRDMGDPPEGHTIERDDVNGNYEPKNCRWIPHWRQNRNTRSSRMITHKGETLCLADWSDRLHIPYMTLLRRLHKGKSFEEAVAMGWGGEKDRRIRAALAAVEGIDTETLEKGGRLDWQMNELTEAIAVEGRRADEAEGMLARLTSHLEIAGCHVCGGDCASANPPVTVCPMRDARKARTLLAKLDARKD